MSGSPRVLLVLGGARSGKSAYAERRAAEAGSRLCYFATGRAWDDEMRERIAVHQARRGPEWTTTDAPLELLEALRSHSDEDTIALVDCLTLWITNLMMAERDVAAEGERLAAGLADMPGRVVLVSSEVGLGIVPENAMARAFRDHAGRLAQDIAAIADEVVLVTAGLPLKLKG